MAILHKHQRQTYTVIDNEAIRDDRLSFRARGLLAYLLSLPDDWRVNAADLAKRTPEGRDAIRTAKVELERAGYLITVKRQDARGRWSTHTHVAESPELLPDLADEPTAGILTAGASDVGIPGALGKTQRNDPEESLIPSELASETEATRSPAQLELDQIKDAFEALGLIPATVNPWPLVNRVATMVRDQGGGPADVVERAGLLSAEWGAEKLTLTSLEKHWHRYDPGGVGRLSKADVDAWRRDQEKQADRDRLLREINGTPADTEAYQAEVRRLRGEQR